MTSTYDSAENIATPLQNRISFTGERGKCRPTTSVSLLQRELSVKFISLPRKCREPAAVFSHKRRSSQETLTDRDGIPFHVPSQPAVVPSPRGMLSRDQSLRPDTWNLLGTSVTFLTIHLHQSTQHQNLIPSTERPVARIEE